MKNRVTSILFVTLLLANGVAIQADDANRNRAAMADAMTRMMDAMGFLGDNATPPSTGWWAAPGGGPMMPSLGNPMPYYGMDQMLERLPQGTPLPGAGETPPWQVGPLEGLWESPNDGLLIVQGNRYRLYQPCAGHVDGTLQVSADRLLLRNRTQGIEHRFEIALQGGRLALRSDNGQIYLYRRLRLGMPR